MGIHVSLGPSAQIVYILCIAVASLTTADETRRDKMLGIHVPPPAFVVVKHNKLNLSCGPPLAKRVPLAQFGPLLDDILATPLGWGAPA